MKIIHFADLHLGMENYGKFDAETGLNSRLDDFLKSFDFLIETAKKEKIDLAVFAGDAFKTRDPSPTYQRALASKIYEIASANIPVVLLVGNHDFPNALGKAHTVEIYHTLCVPNVYVLSNSDKLITVDTQSGPIQIGGLPWYTKNQLISKEDQRLPLEKIQGKLSNVLSKKIAMLSAKVDPKIPSILVLHATIEGATFGSERSVMVGSDILLPIDPLKHSRFNYIAAGHLHKFQALLKKPPVIYSGSIERVDFGEEKEDKGFVLINIEKGNTARWKFVKTPARRFLSIRAKVNNEEDATEQVLNEIAKHNIDNAVVKLIIQISDEKQSELSESKIRSALAFANFIAGIIKEVSNEEHTKIHHGFSDELQSLDTLGILQKYFESKKINKSHQQDLIKIAEGLIEEIQ